MGCGVSTFWSIALPELGGVARELNNSGMKGVWKESLVATVLHHLRNMLGCCSMIDK